LARRHLLTREMLAEHYDSSLDEREIARHFTLTRDDLELIASRRGDATRLGYAMLMLYLRWPGRVLEAGEAPPMPILAFVARQLDVSPASWRDYARRDETRRTHLADLSRRFGHRVFSRADFHALVAFAMPIAQTTTRPSRLAGIVIDEMRRRRLLLPPVTVVEAIVRRARQQAGDLVHDVLAGDLSKPECATRDALLSRRDDKGATWLSWARRDNFRCRGQGSPGSARQGNGSRPDIAEVPLDWGTLGCATWHTLHVLDGSSAPISAIRYIQSRSFKQTFPRQRQHH